METITGKYFKIISEAIPEAERNGINLDLYRISVHDEVGSKDGIKTHYFSVSFTDALAPEDSGRVGNPGKIPGFEVTLHPETLAVLGSHFIR